MRTHIWRIVCTTFERLFYDYNVPAVHLSSELLLYAPLMC